MLQRLERLLLDLAVCAIAGLGLLIAASVILRATLNTGIPDTVILVRELMVAAILLPLAAATAARSHIAVEFMSNLLPQRVQGALVVFGSIAGLIALAPLLYAGWREATLTLQNGAFYFGQLSLPKWPGRVLFLIGLSVCWLRLLTLVVGDLRRLARGLDVPGTTPRPGKTATGGEAR